MNIINNCGIIILGGNNYQESLSLVYSDMPISAKIISQGNTIEELQANKKSPLEEATVLVNFYGSRIALEPILALAPNIIWLHSMAAGVDHILFDKLIENDQIIVTNGKGTFSNAMAEYAMTSISYFAKNLPRLIYQKQNKIWDKFNITEMRGQTVGIIGYGDIGQSCARLAKAYGMKVITQRRRPELCLNDEFVDISYGKDGLKNVMEQSDYVILLTPLTPETRNMMTKEVFSWAKSGQIFINLGRGTLVDEEAMIDALINGNLAGAALDVFAIEPLPESSPLWTMSNVLITPHNSQQTTSAQILGAQLFIKNCQRFVNGETLEYIVDKRNGY